LHKQIILRLKLESACWRHMQDVIWILSESAIFVRKSKMLYTFDGDGGVIFIKVFVAFLVT